MTQAKRTGFEHEKVVALEPPKQALQPIDNLGLPVTFRQSPRLTTAARSTGRDRGGGKGGFIRLRQAFATAVSREKDYGLAFLFLPVAMGTGAGLFYMAPTDPGLPVIAAGLMIALLIVAWTRKSHSSTARVAGFVAALFTGALASGLEVQRGAILLDSDVTTSIVGTVEAREFDPDGRVRYLIRLDPHPSRKSGGRHCAFVSRPAARMMRSQ